MRGVNVLIIRGASTKIPVTVPAHEVPVLESLYGRDDVHRVKTVNLPGKFDAEDAWGALMRKYRGKEQGIVLSLYPNPAALARASEPDDKPAK